MKKSFFLVMSVSVIVLAISCKHQIPGITDTPEPDGGSDSPAASSTCNADTAYFQQQVLPIFISNCAISGCHDNASHEKGIVLTSYSGILSGGIHAGNPDNSKIYKIITASKADDRMPRPPRSPLSRQQMDLISKWISQGAKNNSCVNASCDTTNIAFSTSITSIISDKCQGCHSGSSPAGGYDLNTYAGVQARINDGKLWGAVNHVSGYSPMPKNGTKLSTCELAKIKKWIDAGAPNN